MVMTPSHGELLRTVADLIKENTAYPAEFRTTVDWLEKRVDRLEQENATLRSKLDENSADSTGRHNASKEFTRWCHDNGITQSMGYTWVCLLTD